MDIETLHTSIRDSMEVARQEHCSRVNNKDEKLLTKTKHLMKQRREMLQKHPRNEIQLRQINRDISKSVRKDVRDYNNKWITKTIKHNKKIKVLKKKLSKGKTEINKMENKAQIKSNPANHNRLLFKHVQRKKKRISEQSLIFYIRDQKSCRK